MSKALFVPLKLSLGTVACLYATPLLAQVTPDGTVNTQVNQNENVAEITGGETRGDNLFHSFQDFSVGTGNEAFFNNANDISNIFSRVTGGNISNIDGLIRANGSASLFLINPAGIIFGNNARLDLGGSFYGSTANSILFEDGQFSATDLNNPTLTINAPIGLGFRDNPGNIINQSSSLDADGNPVGLQVNAGQTLTLAGGNIDLTGGNLTASGGNIELGAVASAGTVNINEDNSLDFADSLTRGDITLSEGSLVVVNPLTEGNAGNINLTAKAIALSEISILDASSFVTEGNAGNILLNATDGISLTNSIISSNIGAVTIDNVGEVILQGDSISLTEGSQLQAGFFAGGEGNETTGRILLQADNSVTFDSSAIFANNEPEAIADTVDVEILANSISLTNSTLTTTNDGIGNAGNITLNGRNGAVSITDTVVLIDSTTGQSGNINLSGRSLLLTDNSILGGFTTEDGGAGDVSIETIDFVTLDNGSSISVFSSGNSTGGNIAIDTAQLNILNESGINAFVFEDLPAGSIAINASESVTIGTESTILLNTLGSGDGGNLELNTGSLSITGGSQISSATFAVGDGGDLTINADNIDLAGTTADGLTISRIDASTSGSGTGGNNLYSKLIGEGCRRSYR